MPPIADQNPLSYVGVIFLLGGFFLTLAGHGLIEIKNITITRGSRTWGMGLLLAAIGVLFLLPDIKAAIKPSAEPTSTVIAASNLTLQSPTGTTTTATIDQSTPVNNVTPVLTLTSIPLTSETPTAVSPHSVACVTSQSAATPVEVQADTFILRSFTMGSAGPKLPLANGQKIPFSTMKSFEVLEVTDNPYRIKVEITLLTGEIITEYVPVFNNSDARLEGTPKHGSFDQLLADVKRVEFQPQEGCQ